MWIGGFFAIELNVQDWNREIKGSNRDDKQHDSQEDQPVNIPGIPLD